MSRTAEADGAMHDDAGAPFSGGFVMRHVTLAIVTGVSLAAALWLFGTVQSNREDLVRVQTLQGEQVRTLGEIKQDVKDLRKDLQISRVAE